MRIHPFYATDYKSVENSLWKLNAHLTLRSHIVGYSLTVADLSVWGAIRGNRVAYAAIKKGTCGHVSRWFRYIEDINPWTVNVIQSLNAAAAAKKAVKSKEGASYDVALPQTEEGVVTRFPPEPS